MRKNIALSDRLRALTDFVSRGSRVCDLGCDHAFVPIYLVLSGISPMALAMDVREGPLERAREHIKAYGLEKYIETRLSDGLARFNKGEAESLICAGMGGRLMLDILKRDEEKAASFKEIILQPQSELGAFRRFLKESGYLILKENMIEEDGKFYTVIKAVKAAKAAEASDSTADRRKTLPLEDSLKENRRQKLEDEYGAFLIKNKNAVLIRYLKREIGLCEDILGRLKAWEDGNAGISARYLEIENKRQDCVSLLEEMSGE